MDDGLQIRALNADEEAARLSALALAERLAGDVGPLSVDQVQAVYDALLRRQDRSIEIQIAVGIALGELIRVKSDCEWVRVTDEYGSETSLAPMGLHGACHPISMIQKRLSNEDEIDIAELRDRTIALIAQRVSEGGWAARRGS